MKNLELHYQLQIHEGKKLVSDTGVLAAHSFTIGFAKLLYNIGFQVGAAAPVAITGVSGSSITAYGNMSFRSDASAGTSTYGIMIGSGTTAEAVTDTALAVKIAHGTGSGQLQYGTVTYGAPSTTATTTTFRFTRVFTNGSGGTVTVEEIGLVFGSGSPILGARDLTGTISITNGQQLTVNYDFTTTI